MNPLIILLGSDDPTFRAAVAAADPRIRVVSPADLESDPELIGRIEIAYGGLRREKIPQAASLRWLQTGGAGVEGLLTDVLRSSDCILTNASGVHGAQMTEQMFGMLLMHTRRLAASWDCQKRRHWETGEAVRNVSIIAGRTLGLLGVGAIGEYAARVGRAFNMRVIGLRRSGEPHELIDRMYTPESRLEFFAGCDVVMNTLPHTPTTRYFMDWAEFEALKPGAIIINYGRGPTIRTDALVDGLRSGRVGAALLDVTDPEPLPEDHPLWSMENVLITPHTSGWRPDYTESVNEIFLDNLRRYLDGRPLRNVVDKSLGY